MSEQTHEKEGDADTDSKVGDEATPTDQEAKQGELADAELEGVAGGFLGGLIKKASSESGAFAFILLTYTLDFRAHRRHEDARSKLRMARAVSRR